MLLSEDHRAVQDAVRTYVQDCIAPNAAHWDKHHQFPHEELKGLAALGCYGVAVARLAGVPSPVIAQARNTLQTLETQHRADQSQVDLFAAPPALAPMPAHPVLEALAALDPDALSPREALDALYQLHRLHQAQP